MEASVRRRPRGPRRALTEDEILDAAVTLLDEGGPNAATVRGIAAKVEVSPNAVYTYFPDKAAVLQALIERLLGEVDRSVTVDRDQPWQDCVESLALALRAQLTAHRGAITLMIGGPVAGPHAVGLYDRLLDLLTDAGLRPPEAARAAYLLIVYVFGFIAVEVTELVPPGLLPAEAGREPTRAPDSSDMPRQQPAMSTARPGVMAGYISTEQYLWGLRRVLHGITAGTTATSRHRVRRTGAGSRRQSEPSVEV
jgi:TetR/AcrR family transcriptional regulator, tetracycline repressor protein